MPNFMSDNPSTVPSEADVTSEGGENVGGETQAPSYEEKLLQEINEATGRNYKTLEEAKKGIKETYSFVGSDVIAELRRKAQEYDKLKTRMEKERTPEVQQNEFYQKVDKLELVMKHPDVEPYADLVGAIAREKGISWIEAYEQTPEGKKIQAMVERDRKEKEKESPSFAESNQRIPGGKMGISREEFAKLPLEEQKKIISKLPAWNDKFPQGHFISSKLTK